MLFVSFHHFLSKAEPAIIGTVSAVAASYSDFTEGLIRVVIYSVVGWLVTSGLKMISDSIEKRRAK